MGVDTGGVHDNQHLVIVRHDLLEFHAKTTAGLTRRLSAARRGRDRSRGSGLGIAGSRRPLEVGIDHVEQAAVSPCGCAVGLPHPRDVLSAVTARLPRRHLDATRSLGAVGPEAAEMDPRQPVGTCLATNAAA